jgi:prepilin-type N-terminal cleavage/methylation domain-containing protein
MRHSPARGFTLAEVMVVMVLASVVTLGLVGFYLNSQATWIDGSSQALAQRDATLIVESLTDKAREAASYEILPTSPPSTNQIVVFFDNGLNELSRFTWEADSLVHLWQGGDDKGPVASSIVERFELAPDTSPVLHLQMLQVRATNGARVQMHSSMAMYNAP